MLPRRALAAGHFELNDWPAIPIYTTLASPSKPEAASRHARLVGGKCLHEQVRIFHLHPLTGPEHFERRIETQERLQEVLLIPESMPSPHPPLWIFQGQKDVVHVQHNP